MFAGAQVGAHVWVATPHGYEPKAEAVRWATDRGRETGGTCNVTHDPREAVLAADVVYTDVWASMGQESEKEKRQKLFKPYQVNQQLFRHAQRTAIFLHCLPAHRGDEVTADVIDSPQSLVFQQAENRLHAQKAIMLELMKGPPATNGMGAFTGKGVLLFNAPFDDVLDVYGSLKGRTLLVHPQIARPPVNLYAAATNRAAAIDILARTARGSGCGHYRRR